MAEHRPTAVVVGGGMSGIAAARVLAGLPPVSRDDDPSPAWRVILLEAEGRLGGKVRAASVGSAVVDFGPDQFLRRDASAERLCRHLGLGPDLVEPAVRNAAVYARGEMRMLPSGLVLGVPTDLDSLAASGIVSTAAVERAREDGRLGGPVLTAEALGLAEPTDTSEVAAGALFRRRLGDEIVDRLIDPLLGGINAGRVDGLSLGVIAPQLAGALVGERGVLAPLASHFPSRREGAASPFFGLRGGLHRLVAAVKDELESAGVAIARDATAVSIERRGSGFSVHVQGDGTSRTLSADGVVLASPGYVAGEMLEDSSPVAARALASIDYASVTVVTLRYPAGSLSLPPGSSGVLVPRVEGKLISAATWLSQKWPWLAPEGEVVVRLSAGRDGDERALALSGGELTEAVLRELTEVAGIEARPSDSSVVRFERSFPQYRPGHLQRIEKVRHELADLGAVELAGAVLGGIGVPACISSGEAAATRLAGRLVA